MEMVSLDEVEETLDAWKKKKQKKKQDKDDTEQMDNTD
jgi:hypothetical protein